MLQDGGSLGCCTAGAAAVRPLCGNDEVTVDGATSLQVRNGLGLWGSGRRLIGLSVGPVPN
jgi:hypothetical protein